MLRNKLYTVNKWNKSAFMPKGNLFDVGGSFWNGGTSGFIPFDSEAAARDVELIRGIQFDPNKAANALLQPIQQSLTQKIAMDGYKAPTMISEINKATTPVGSDNTSQKVTVKPSTMQAIGMASNFMDKIPTGDKRGMWDTLDPVYHLAGGRESAAGNAMSDAGVALTKSGLQSGQPYMALAGAALKVVGGLTNAAFGIKENKQLREIADTSINTNSNFKSNATSFDDIKGPSSMTNTNVYEGGWFSGGKASDKNDALARDMATAYSWADRSVLNNARNITSDLNSDFLRNYSAYGGLLDYVDPSTPIGYSIYTDRYRDKLKNNLNMTNMFTGTPDLLAFGGNIATKGANFDTGVSFINTGGTHELNPNEGVQMGVDSQGVPNLVEEGEVKWGDYMFSDRLIVPRGKRGNYGKRARKYAEGGKLAKGRGIDTPYESKVLKPFEGLTFAEAAKKIIKRNGADERDDAITMRGIDAELSVLAGILEKEREKEKLREMQETIDNMSPEEFAMLLQQMEAQQAALQQQEMAMQQLQMIPEGMELMVPLELMAAAYGGPIYELGGLLNNWDVAPAVLTSTTETPIAENRYDFGSWLLKINPALYNEYLKEIKFNTDTVEPYIKKKLAENPNYSAIDDDLFPMLDDTNPLLAKLKAFYEEATEGDAEEHWSNKVQTNVEDDGIRAKNFDDLTAADINNIFGWEASTPVEKTSEGAISKEAESAAKVEGPEAEVFDFYNRRHPNEPKSAEQWNALDKKEKAEYIRAYRKTLKDKKEDFDKRLDDYNKLQELNDKVAKYQEQQRKSTLTAEDIKDLSYEDKVRLAKYMNPDYQAHDLSKLSLNERDEAKKALDEQLVLMSKDKDITLDNLSKNFAAPQYHRDWKPVDAEQAWKDRPNEYDYLHPFYGGAHDVVRGNTEGKYQPRSWVNDEGKIVINAGDKTYTYNTLEDYEKSDEYLKPRYELAKSAAALDETKLKIWNDYVNGLNQDYKASYAPTTVFGENYADYLYDTEDKDNYDKGYAKFKQYIIDKYDDLKKANSGFFDLKAGLMHGMMLPTRQRELYQMKDNPGTYLTPEGNWQDYYTDTVTDDNKGTILHTLAPKGGIAFTRMSDVPEGVEVKPDGTYVARGTGETDTFPKPSNWPYAVAAGLLLGALGYNMFKPADYGNADALLKASEEAGNYRPVEFRPIGNYLPYKPMDIWFEQNRLNANARATDRAIMNSGANQGSKAAALLASGYNNQLASGNLYRQALEYNDALRKQVTDFNRGTNMFNSEGFLKADMANLDAATRAAGYTLEGKKAAYAMRQAIDDAKANAISVGISGLGNLAMAYGQNKWNQDVLRWKLKHNQYPISLLEGHKYDHYTGKPVTASKGGKLKRRHKGLGF